MSTAGLKFWSFRKKKFAASIPNGHRNPKNTYTNPFFSRLACTPPAGFTEDPATGKHYLKIGTSWLDFPTGSVACPVGSHLAELRTQADFDFVRTNYGEI